MNRTGFSAGWRTFRPLGGVVLAVWLLLVIIASQSTLWERDESRYATAAREMETSGNWLYPTFNGELRAFQPAMIYWLMASSLQVFGPSEVSVRLPSTLAAAFVCLLTGLIAREFLDSGVMAAALAGTSPLVLLTGSAATTDATLLAGILLSQWVFVRAWTRGPRRWHLPVLAVAIGLAMLTKGPVGLVVPVLTIGTTLALARGRSKAGPFAGKLLLAALGGCLIFLAWGIPANAATGNAYWEIAIARRLPKFLFSAMEGHGGAGLVPYLLHLPYYLAVLAVGFLPWTIYLVLVPGAFRRMEREAGSEWATGPDGLRTLLMGMMVPTFVLMTLMVSKLPHYILPVLPWLAILTASALATAEAQVAAKRMRMVVLVLGAPVLLAAAGLIVVPWCWPPLSVFRGQGMVLGLLVLVSLGLLARCFWRDDVRGAVRLHFGVMGAVILATVLLVLPPVERLAKPAQHLARDVFAQIPPGTPVASYGWKEPGMHFYLGAARIQYLMDASLLGEWLDGEGPRFLIFSETAAPGLALPPAGFRVLGTREGIDHVRGRPLRLTALLKE